MKKLLPLLLLLVVSTVAAQNYAVSSPDKRIAVSVKVAGGVSYSISYDGKTVVKDSKIALDIRGVAKAAPVVDKRERSVDQFEKVVVPIKRTRVRNRFQELSLKFTNGLGLVWRVYDNGAAYHWTSEGGPTATIDDETVEINLDPADTLFFPEEDEGFYSHNERHYINYKSSELASKLASTPTLVSSTAGVKLWISEADLRDYAGMWLRGNGGNGLKGVFPKAPLKEEAKGDRDVRVTERADYIAVTKGTRGFPWRVFGIAARDADLLDNQLVWLLSTPSDGDYSWIKPGKVPWDWWNANNVYGVGFKAGVNTATYKYYIDFAAKYGLEYLILDEGWSKTDDLLTVNPDVDLPELLRYGKQKNVGIVLWCLWTSLDQDTTKILDQFAKWGVKGVKVDFMQRDDQKLVNYYERIARETAKRKMMVDFHGAYKPAGLYRTYPNFISNEGVKGLENSKWSKDITPEHDVMLPFTRMVAGPMDFTPGAMINASPKEFTINFNRPMSQGTRCHQLAMYVVYESPLQMLADNPSNYYREPASMEFLSKVPSVWQETFPLDGKVGEYVAVARRTLNGEFYVGVMNNSTARELTLDFSFLGPGAFQTTVWEDGVNVDRYASDFKKSVNTIRRGDKIKIKLAAGGGWAAHLVSR